jgi:hypothetical protein
MSIGPDLFTATYRGDAVRVTHATAEEVSLLAESVEQPQDMLEFWSLISIHYGFEVRIHALGWRLLLANVWMTSAVVAVDRALGAVRTQSWRRYLLGVRDWPELDQVLRAHLEHTLRTWGFKDVCPSSMN